MALRTTCMALRCRPRKRSALVQIALGEVDELALLDAEDPDVAAGRDDNSLHQPERAIKVMPFRGRQRLAILVELGDGLAAVGGEPSVVLGINSRAEGAAFHPAAGEARSMGESGWPFGANLVA